MNTPWILSNLWLIPFFPLLAAFVLVFYSKDKRDAAAYTAIGAIGISFLLSLGAFFHSISVHNGETVIREYVNFSWFEVGNSSLKLGFLLDPLTAVMLVMVSLCSTLIFIYSMGYMSHDKDVVRFFSRLSLFAASMLGLLISNSLILLFICWELVGLTSYLLIGFWYQKNSAAAAGKKAFITTRIGDVCLMMGMFLWYAQSGTLLFYDSGMGALEQTALANSCSKLMFWGLTCNAVIGLLIFGGAIGKSAQFPLHVWLPDAMEGPTPVSALIHAATMVAAGVFLMARVYPLVDPSSVGLLGGLQAKQALVWIGAISALIASLIAVAQNDIKRILAYSTMAQLGYMMLGLGVGGVAIGMFHLITHAFFKALLFMGAGSVIHGCNGEQDIRLMGNIRNYMPITFVTYAIGMMALAGVPLFFSGFWSKDEILHSAMHFAPSKIPFIIATFSAILTAFYMTRQICYVFYGKYRGAKEEKILPDESPSVMTMPLIILATLTVLLSFIGTPALPLFNDFLSGNHCVFQFKQLFEGSFLLMVLLSLVTVTIGAGGAWMLYKGGDAIRKAHQKDPLISKIGANSYQFLSDAMMVDKFYSSTIIRFNYVLGKFADWCDRKIWESLVKIVCIFTTIFAYISRFADDYLINGMFNLTCSGNHLMGRLCSMIQDGRLQHYLRVLAVSVILLIVIVAWRIL